MSEPPDDAWDDEELEEFLDSELFAEMGDDMLLDRVARGDDDRSLVDDVDMDYAEWELQDYLHDLHDQPDDEPVPELVDREEAKRIIAEAKKKYDEQKAAEARTQSKGEDKVAISDDAQQVAQIANDESASQAMGQAVTALADAIGSLNAAEGHLSTVGQNMQAAGEAASSQASQAGSLLGGEDGQTITAQGQALGQAISDALSKIADIDISGMKQNLQGVSLEELSGQIQALRDAIKAAALKHQ